MRICLVSNYAWTLLNFRSGLIQRLVDDGHQVLLVARPDGTEGGLPPGAAFAPWWVSLRGMAPGEEARSLDALRFILRRFSPDLVFSFTIKATVHSGFATPSGARFVPTVNGLGAQTTGPHVKSRLLRRALVAALSRATHVLCQNPTDTQTLIAWGVSPDGISVIPGSGVDAARFVPPRERSLPVKFLFAGRYLHQKGVLAYLEAARALAQFEKRARFSLAGRLEEGPDALTEEELKGALRDSPVADLGFVNDMPALMRSHDVLVLPSRYPEGLPRVNLEAQAAGMLVITSDQAGCKASVLPGETGWILPDTSAAQVRAAMAHVLALAPAERARMATAARAFVCTHFREHDVVARYLDFVS